MEWQLQQVDQDLGIEHHNNNSEITLFLFLDIIDHEISSINRTKSIVGLDPFRNDVIDIILVYLLLNT